jgi:hypothetical protein
MSALDRLPALATAGVGSLPFARPGRAARHAVRAYELPFCPQLPRLDGDMVHEWLGDDPGRCGWAADRDRQLPAAWSAFVHELATSPPDHGLVKLQVTGPVTLAAALERSAGRPGHGVAVAELAREVAAWLAANVAEQARGLNDLGLDVVLVVDEPGLAQAGLAPSDAGAWDPLRATAAAAWGVHVCGVVPWQLVDALSPDLVSFDLARYGLAREARAVLARVMAGGGRVAWGVIDPVAPCRARAAAGLVAGAIAASGLPAGLAAERSLITPACGTGRLSIEREELVADTLTRAAAHARLGSSLRGNDDLEGELGGADRARAG